MHTSNNSFVLAAIVSTAAAIPMLFSSMAHADLNVNGTDNGNWSNNGTMIYTSASTDPTSVSSGQFELSGGGSLTVNSGSLTLTNTQYGAFIGQQGAGSLTVNGGSFTWNADGSNEQRAVIGNSGNTGTVDITGGTFAYNVGAGSDGAAGLIFGRQGGSTIMMISGTGIFISQSEYFGMGGEYSSNTWGTNGGGSNVVTLGSGNGVFELDGLGGASTSFFNVNTSSSAFNFLSGSDGQISINGATQSFYNSLITSGDIQLNGAADTNTSDFAFVQSGGQGVLELQSAAVVPEPSTYALMLGGLGVLFFFARRHRKV